MLGLGLAVGGAIYNGIASGKKKRDALAEQDRLQTKLDHLESSRQTLINPYDDVTSLAGMAVDMSSQMTNTSANIGVATQAAEIQIEEADNSIMVT